VVPFRATSEQTLKNKAASQDEAARYAASLDALMPVAGEERRPQPSPEN
jgi:hypothetical protein